MPAPRAILGVSSPSAAQAGGEDGRVAEAALGRRWRVVVSPAQRTLRTAEPLEAAFEVSDAASTSTSAQKLLRETVGLRRRATSSSSGTSRRSAKWPRNCWAWATAASRCARGCGGSRPRAGRKVRDDLEGRGESRHGRGMSFRHEAHCPSSSRLRPGRLPILPVALHAREDRDPQPDR